MFYPIYAHGHKYPRWLFEFVEPIHARECSSPRYGREKFFFVFFFLPMDKWSDHTVLRFEWRAFPFLVPNKTWSEEEQKLMFCHFRCRRCQSDLDRINWKNDEEIDSSLTLVSTYTDGMPCIWIGVGREIFFAFKALRTPTGNFISWRERFAEELEKERSIHFESTERWRNIIAFDNDIVDLTNSLMTLFSHSLDHPGRSPTTIRISSIDEWFFIFKPGFYWIGVFDTFGDFSHTHQRWREERSMGGKVKSPRILPRVSTTLRRISSSAFKISSVLFFSEVPERIERSYIDSHCSEMDWLEFFFNSLIWSNRVKFAWGPTLISSCTGGFCTWSVSNGFFPCSCPGFNPPKIRCN